MSKSPMGKKLGDIEEVLQATPELNNYPVEMWQQTHDFLKGEGFSSQKFTYMISQNPKLLTIPHEKLFASISNWRALQFGERDTVKLLEQYPELLHLSHTNDLNKKIDCIKDFIGGGNNLFKLLFNSPSVLSQNLPTLNEKIDYLRNIMKVEPADVFNSDALSNEIITIKTRHIFLKRLGLYVVKKKNETAEMSKNPKLSQITDTSDKRFATKVCHVTLEEFETFQELYQEELDDELSGESSGGEEYSDNEDEPERIDVKKR